MRARAARIVIMLPATCIACMRGARARGGACATGATDSGGEALSASQIMARVPLGVLLEGYRSDIPPTWAMTQDTDATHHV